jgi:glycosyltransferase involved in cell wall biosynthesis
MKGNGIFKAIFNMKFPKISVITISLNSARYIEECIRSVVEQNYPALEYIIIDGGSTDGTLDIINKYADKISVIVSERDPGPAVALNKGFSKVTGEIMGWLNSDDRMHPKSG